MAVLTERIGDIAALVRLRPFDTSTPEGRSRERLRRVALTTLASVGAKAVSAVTMLISVALTVRYLGPERYGMWMTISGAVAMLSFTDLGMGSGLLTSLSEAHGREDSESARRAVSSAFFMLLGTGLVVLILFAAVYAWVPWPKVFNVASPAARDEAGPVVFVLVACFALGLPLGIAQRVQMGYQEGFAAHAWMTAGSILGLIGVLISVHMEAGLPALALAVSAGPLAASLGNSLVQFGRVRPWLAPAPRGFEWRSTKRLAATGFFFLLLQVLTLLGTTSDTLVIAHMLGPSSVAGYSVALRLFTLALISQYFIGPLWPAFAEAMARKEYGWAERTLKRALFAGFAAAVAAGIPLVIFGRPIVAAWAGAAVTPSIPLLIALAAGLILASWGGTLAAFMNSGSLLGRQVVLYGVASVAALALKFVLVPYWREAGVVWATVWGYGLLFVIPGTWLVARNFRTLERNEDPAVFKPAFAAEEAGSASR